MLIGAGFNTLTRLSLLHCHEENFNELIIHIHRTTIHFAVSRIYKTPCSNKTHPRPFTFSLICRTLILAAIDACCSIEDFHKPIRDRWNITAINREKCDLVGRWQAAKAIGHWRGVVAPARVCVSISSVQRRANEPQNALTNRSNQPCRYKNRRDSVPYFLQVSRPLG